MGARHSGASPSDRVGFRFVRRKRFEKKHELWKRECPVDPGAGVDDRSLHMVSLEAEHQVERLEIQLGQSPCSMGAEVEVERARKLDRLRQGGNRPQLEDACGGGTDQVAGSGREGRSRKRAPEAIAGADEGDGELRLVSHGFPC